MLAAEPDGVTPAMSYVVAITAGVTTAGVASMWKGEKKGNIMCENEEVVVKELCSGNLALAKKDHDVLGGTGKFDEVESGTKKSKQIPFHKNI